MRISIIWVIESIKLLARRPLDPVNAECPFCHQMVRLHYNRAGWRHLLAHARALYEGSRYSAHYMANAKCLGSGTLAKFDPHPNENQHFKWPKSLDSTAREFVCRHWSGRIFLLAGSVVAHGTSVLLTKPK